MQIINKLQMDLSARGVMPVVDAVQNDTNTRSVEISLSANGTPWDVPDGVTASVAYCKPDGTKGLYDKLPDETGATSIEGSIVKAALAPQVLTVPGKTHVSIILIDADLNQLATFPFIVSVTPNPAGGVSVSENYFNHMKFLFDEGEGAGSIVRVIHDPDESPLAQPTATGESAISLGRYCYVPGKNAMAVNYDNQVAGTYGFAANRKNIIGEDASSSSAFGGRNEIYAAIGFVTGWINKILAGAENGFVAGTQNILDVPDGARFGRFGKLTKALFAIGNGTGTLSRSNAFEVFEDGSMALNEEVFTDKELRLAITRAATMAAILLSDEKAIFTAEELRNTIDNVGEFTVAELRETVDNVAKFTPEQLQAVIDYVAAFTPQIMGGVVNKSAMMAPIIDTTSGEVAQVPLALSVKGLSLYGKTTQDGTPTPEAPVELVSVGASGAITTIVTGNNLLSLPYYDGGIGTVKEMNGITWTVNADGSVTANGTATAGSYFVLNRGTAFASSSATAENVSVTVDGITFTNCRLNAGGPTTSINVGSGVTVSNRTYYPMINKGDVALPYEQPKTVQTLTVQTPNGLPGIPVSTGGNYTDESGQQWICDRIDLERGVYVQRIGTKVFDGTETWKHNAEKIPDMYYIDIPSMVSYKIARAYCTHFCPRSGDVEDVHFGKTDNCYFKYEAIGNDKSAWLAWLAEQYAAGTPVTVVYVLTEPVETPLEDLYKSAVYTFTEGDSRSIAVGFETDTWALRYRNSTGGRVFSKSTYIQGNTFSVPSSFVLEIKNDTPGVFDMVIDAEKSSSAAGAEVYYFSQAPADGWTDDVVNAFTPDSAEYVGLLDGAAGIDDLQYRKDTEGNFFLLFKATDLDTNTSGPLRIYSFTMEQVPLEDCMANEPNLSVMAEGAGISVTYAADAKTYIDGKFTELQNAILAAGANV